jgi:hypothetical protein
MRGRWLTGSRFCTRNNLKFDAIDGNGLQREASPSRGLEKKVLLGESDLKLGQGFTRSSHARNFQLIVRSTIISSSSSRFNDFCL